MLRSGITRLVRVALGLSTTFVFVACGGAPQQANNEYGWEKQDLKKGGDSSSSGGSSNAGSSGAGDGTDETKWTGAAEPTKLNQEQEEQMKVALKRGGTKAANCSAVVENGPTGEGKVEITFDGKIGKVTEVNVLPPFAGTAVETCIKRAFVGEYCLPFEGDPKVVTYTVKLPSKAAPPADPKKK